MSHRTVVSLVSASGIVGLRQLVCFHLLHLQFIPLPSSRMLGALWPCLTGIGPSVCILYANLIPGPILFCYHYFLVASFFLFYFYQVVFICFGRCLHSILDREEYELIMYSVFLLLLFFNFLFGWEKGGSGKILQF